MSDMKMAWVDMETTGLEADKDVPLELGIALTDEWGEIAAEAKWLIWEDSPAYDLGMERAQSNEFVKNMHDKSGLWNDLGVFDLYSRSQAEEQAIEFLMANEVEPGTLPMAGNSIGSLDRPFMLRHFPRLNVALHYRNIDMSSIKEIVRLVNPELYANLKPIIGTKEDADHRVLGDIRASIREYKAYLDNFFFLPEA